MWRQAYSSSCNRTTFTFAYINKKIQGHNKINIAAKMFHSINPSIKCCLHNEGWLQCVSNTFSLSLISFAHSDRLPFIHLLKLSSHLLPWLPLTRLPSNLPPSPSIISTEERVVEWSECQPHNVGRGFDLQQSQNFYPSESEITMLACTLQGNYSAKSSL